MYNESLHTKHYIKWYDLQQDWLLCIHKSLSQFQSSMYKKKCSFVIHIISKASDLDIFKLFYTHWTTLTQCILFIAPNIDIFLLFLRPCINIIKRELVYTYKYYK